MLENESEGLNVWWWCVNGMDVTTWRCSPRYYPARGLPYEDTAAFIDVAANFLAGSATVSTPLAPPHLIEP